MTNYKYDSKTIIQNARGKWERILPALAPALKPALDACPRHVACPVHGGTDGFRFYPDYAENGNCVCNTCGNLTGLEILMKVNHWDYFKTLKSISDFLSLPSGHANASPVDTSSAFTKKGKVIELGIGRLKNGRECFRLRLKTPDGEEYAFWGADLKRVSEEAGLKPGDNADVSRLGTRDVTVRGRTYQKTLWAAVRLPSDEEIERAMCRQHEADLRRSTAISVHWKAASPLSQEANLLTQYFEKRSLTEALRVFPSWLKDIRFRSNESYGEGKYFPCMTCAVRSKDGGIVTLHRTFLTDSGMKIPESVGPAKKLMAIASDATINGAGIRIGEVGDDGILCVTEGVETALSVVVGTGYPCVAAITATGMGAFELPLDSKPVKAMLIFADKDVSGTGQEAAKKLQRRMTEAGIPALVFLPTGDVPNGAKGIDWNDVLKEGGSKVFPVKREAVA